MGLITIKLGLRLIASELRRIALGLRLSCLGLLLLFLLQTGCWNAREINELAFVMGIGLDKAEGGGVKVTVQMAKPSTFSKTPTGGGGQEKEKPFWIASATGKTIFEAIRDMATFSSRRIFWAHNKVIIIGEDLARTDISEILDFFSRNPELRLRTWIAVTPGDAGKLLETGPSMEQVTAASLEKIFDQRVWTGKSPGGMLKDFLEDYLSPGTFPVASKIAVVQGPSRPTTRLAGGAVFKENKLAGWLDEQETRGLLWLKDKMGSALMVVPCPEDGRPLSIEITGAEIKYQSKLNGEQLQLTVMVKTMGNLTEQSCKTDFYKLKNLHKLENAFAAAVSADIQATITAAQKDFGLDFPGLNRAIHRQQDKDWDRLSKQWPRLFKTMKISVRVEADIPRVALFARPLEPMKGPRAGSQD